MPMREREDKGTQDGINRLRDLVKLRSLIETAKFPVERRLRVSAKYLIRQNGISPPHQLAPAAHTRRESTHSISKNIRRVGVDFHHGIWSVRIAKSYGGIQLRTERSTQ